MFFLFEDAFAESHSNLIINTLYVQFGKCQGKWVSCLPTSAGVLETKFACPEDEVMCHCSGIKRSYIKSLFEQGKDIEAISRWTGALSGCGGCEWDIGDYLKELAAQRESGMATNE